MAPWKQLFRSSTDGHDLGQQPPLDKTSVTVSSGYHQGHSRRRIWSESNHKTTTTRAWSMRSSSMAESRPSTAPTLAQPKHTTTSSVPPSGTVGRITKRIFRPDVDKPSIKAIMRPMSADSMQNRNRKPSSPLIIIHLGGSKDPSIPQVSQLRFLEPHQEDEQQQNSPTGLQDSSIKGPRNEAILVEDALRQESLRAALAIDPTPSIPRSSDSRQRRQPRRPVPKPVSPPPSPYPSVSAPVRLPSPEVASQPAIDANPVVLQSKWSADSTPKILLRPLSNASSFERQDLRLLQRQVQAASMRRVQSAQLPVANTHLEVSGQEPATQPCITPRLQAAVSSVPSPPVLILPAPARSPHHSTVTTKGHSPVMSPALPLRTALPAVASSSAMDSEGGGNRDSFVSLDEEVLDYGSLGLPTERADSSEPTQPPPAPVPTKARLTTVLPVCAAHLDDSLVSGSGWTSDTIVSFATIRKWREQVAIVEPNVRMKVREVNGAAGEAGPSTLSPEQNNLIHHATATNPARLDQDIEPQAMHKAKANDVVKDDDRDSPASPLPGSHLSWGTQARRTLSEAEAERVFGHTLFERRDTFGAAMAASSQPQARPFHGNYLGLNIPHASDMIRESLRQRGTSQQQQADLHRALDVIVDGLGMAGEVLQGLRYDFEAVKASRDVCE